MLPKYIIFAVILNFLVDFLLLSGTNRMTGYPPGGLGNAAAAGLGALMTAASFLPGFSFLRNFSWRAVSIACMSWIAFGWKLSAVRRGLLFALLNMALYGITQSIGSSSAVCVLGAAGIVLLICFLGFRGTAGGRSYIPVELSYGNSHVRILALQDTGNTLSDPITGRPVLVVGSDVALQLTGLTLSQLERPVETMGTLPGLRLIPYHTVGQSGGFLLALRLPHVKIGNYSGSALVAFAPRSLDGEGTYQALTGGVL